MDLKIERFRLEGVTPDLILYETVKTKAKGRAKKENIGKEREVVIGYYTCFETALKTIHSRLVTGHTKTTLKSLLEALRASNLVILKAARLMEIKNAKE